MRNFLTALLVFAICALLTVIGWTYWAGHTLQLAQYWSGADDATEVGQWGDSFGGFNAVFGALGFSAVLATLISQVKTMNDQVRDQHKQRFESSFFELIKLIDQLRCELKFAHSRDWLDRQDPPIRLTVKNGRDAIIAATMEMRTWIKVIRINDKHVDKDKVAAYYMKYIHGRYESRFAPYFRMIFSILNKIKNDNILEEKDKIYYANIVRSHLSTHEISLLAVNALSPVSGELKSLVEEFRMLKYLPRGSMKRVFEKHFKKTTFQARQEP